MTGQTTAFLTTNQSIDGKYFIAGRGDPDGQVMVVASAPNHDDLRNNLILSDYQDQWLRRNLNRCGLKYEKCWYTSVVKHRIAAAKPKAAEIKACLPYFQAEVDRIKPRLIITLGGEAYKAVMGKTVKFTDWIGMPHRSRFGTVLPTYSPYVVEKEAPGLIVEVEQHLIAGARHFNNHKYDDWTYEVVTDPERNKELLAGYLDKGLRKISLDGEWLPAVWNDDEQMFSLQWAMEPNHGIILKCNEFERARGHNGIMVGGIMEERREMVLAGENKALLDSMKAALERPDIEILGWNAKVDLKRLARRGFKFHDQALKFDGMMATAFLNFQHRKGLEAGIFNYSNLPLYWVPLYERLADDDVPRSEMVRCSYSDPDIWNKYISGDAVSHYQVNVNMMDAMSRLPQRVQDYYYHQYLPLTWYLLEMEATGLPVDVECMEDMTKLYEAGYKLLYDKMQGYAAAMGMEKYNPHYFAYINDLFLNKLDLPAPYYTKGKKGKSRFWHEAQADPKVTRGYKPSTNQKGLNIMLQDCIKALEQNPEDQSLKLRKEIVECQVNLGRLNPIANKFLSKKGVADQDDAGDDDGEEGEGLKTSYWAGLGKDNRIYSDFYPCLENFRCSSRPNLQNMPSKVLPKIEQLFRQITPELMLALPGREDCACVPKNIRNIFYSGHPDWLFAEIDVAGADLMHAAYIANDAVFKKRQYSGNFHVEMARAYFNDPTLSKDTAPDKIIHAKTFTFNSAYTSHFSSAAWAIQAMIYGESGQHIPAEEITKLLDSGWNSFPDYMRFKKWVQRSVEENFEVSNIYGLTQTFTPSREKPVLARYVNQALAWTVASVMALHTHTIINNLRRYLMQSGLWMKYVYPVTYVHDAAYLLVHKALLQDSSIQNIVFHYFCKTPTVTGEFVGAEMVIADCWKSKKPVYEKKTKWSFEQKCWTW